MIAASAAVVLQQPVVKSPLPGGAASLVRFLFNTVPQWVQIAGVGIAVVAGLWVVYLVWRHRVAVRQWYVTRRRKVQIALAGAATLTIVGFTAFGAVSWNYMQHDNGFCTGCHVMGPAFQRFVESEHDSLSCHDCHQQSIFASARQLYLWVAERPDRIGPHARLPNQVCERCHVTGDARKTWQRIASTAGHRTHLESDSSALKDVKCVTCHALEVHRFAPVDSTCAQANCHVTIEIRLAKMRDQTDLHCVTCHQFTADVPRLATRDSASGTLVPSMKQCFSCHAMRKVIESFDPERDPHQGTCGMCHNPHTQESPAEAARTCASANCHAGWRQEPFHTGANHRAVAQTCTLCHQPHAARVDASDCAGCHRALQGRREHGRTLRPPLPFDTTRALRRVSELVPRAQVTDDRVRRGQVSRGRSSRSAFAFASLLSVHLQPREAPSIGPPTRPPIRAAPDTFNHDRHKALACITCHTSGRRAGRLTFQPPRGCQICHHQAPQTSNCAQCHQPSEIAPAADVTLTLAVRNSPPRRHPARFDHATHQSLQCVQCHSTPVSLDPAPNVANCASCHDDHHAASRQCATCHAVGAGDAERRAPHTPPTDAHAGCDACHAAATIARLVPDRSMCVTCHVPQRDHYAGRECTVCHFQATPGAYRDKLTRRAAGGGAGSGARGGS